MDKLEKLIKDTYNLYFALDLDKTELKEKAKQLYSNTQDVIKKMKGYNEKTHGSFYERADRLLFTFSELGEIIQRKLDEPNSEFYKNKKFIEMVSAMNYLVYAHEVLGKEWYAELRDSPDIKLIDISSRNLTKRSQIVAYIEVLQFSELLPFDRGKFVQLLTKEVKEKKFIKRYGDYTWLLINIINNEPTGDQLRLLSISIYSMKENPYSRIYLTNIPLFSRVLRMDLLFPKSSPLATKLS